jgi:hypothetical protein
VEKLIPDIKERLVRVRIRARARARARLRQRLNLNPSLPLTRIAWWSRWWARPGHTSASYP